MSTLKLRPYQEEALVAVSAAWSSGMQRPAVVLPTGMGKTVIFANMAKDEVRAGGLPLILVHREELVTQTIAKLHSVEPGITVGVIKANRNETDASVLVGSVQTLARAGRRESLPAVSLVIVDECHHAAAKSYMDILEHVGAFAAPCKHCGGTGKDATLVVVDPYPIYEPHGCGYCEGKPAARAVGFTATMSRQDNRGLGDVWQDVVYQLDIMYGIKHGYLTDVRGKTVTVDGLDLGEVARSRGDYQDGALGDALTESGAGVVVAEKYREYAGDRQGVIFTPTVATAYGVAEDFNAAGIRTETITGATPPEERALTYKRYQAGEVQVLANCMVLTEGWDAPWASCAVIMRPTTSQSLYVQMVGRVLRPWSGKTDALVLDVMGVSTRLKLAGMVDLSTTAVKPRDGESLAEAIEREEQERAEHEARPDKAKRARLAGQVDVQDVDLFHGSESAWLQTAGGVWFVPTTKFLFFLWPDTVEGLWRIGKCGTHTFKVQGAGWLQDGMDFGYARAIAEQAAREEDPTISLRARGWRKTPPRQVQLDYAQRLGVQGTELMNKGQVSDAISVANASKLLDRRVKK